MEKITQCLESCGLSVAAYGLLIAWVLASLTGAGLEATSNPTLRAIGARLNALTPFDVTKLIKGSNPKVEK